MVLPLYLAMTAAEIRANTDFPPNIGYMACHFSPYGTGLSNCPAHLPEGSMLILNDRTPVYGHCPERIAQQLMEMAEVSPSTLTRLRRNEVVSLTVLLKFCKVLGCDIGDVVEATPIEENN